MRLMAAALQEIQVDSTMRKQTVIRGDQAGSLNVDTGIVSSRSTTCGSDFDHHPRAYEAHVIRAY